MSVSDSNQTAITLAKRLSEKQVRSYVENGDLCVSGLLGTDELAELKADLNRIARGHYPSATLQPLPSHVSDADALKNYMNAWSLLPLSPTDGERVAIADRRKIIPVAGVDPYAWKGVEVGHDEIWLGTIRANTPEHDEHA